MCNQYKILYKGGQELPGLYVLKFIGCILIVICHTDFYGNLLMVPIIRIARPVFLIISGYFLVNKEGKIEGSRVYHFFKSIISLVIVGNLVYYLFDIINNPVKEWGSLSASDIFSFLLTVKSAEIHLWYLTCWAGSLVIIYIISKAGLDRYLWIFIPIGILLSLIFGRYDMLFFKNQNYDFLNSLNYLTIGLPLSITGIMLRRYESRFSLNKKQWKILSLIFIISIYAEGWLTRSFTILEYGTVFIFSLPLAISIFMWFKSISCEGKIFKCLKELGKSHSKYVYLWHMIFVRIIQDHYNAIMEIPYMAIIIVSLSSILLSHFIIKSKYYIKVLNYSIIK